MWMDDMQYKFITNVMSAIYIRADETISAWLASGLK
jgi:hypothetical protein